MTQTVLLSALQHYTYCPRQCALIHVEGVWEANVFTARGDRVHQKVDLPGGSTRDGVRLERALPLWSERHGLEGKADLVEFLPDGTPYPVEHKVGRKPKRADAIQLCAQALCLEEMTGRAVLEGALFYFGLRSRRSVPFDAALRAETLETVQAVRTLLGQSHLPAPVQDARCEACSLQALCLPQAPTHLPPRFDFD